MDKKSQHLSEIGCEHFSGEITYRNPVNYPCAVTFLPPWSTMPYIRGPGGMEMKSPDLPAGCNT